jgi:hypothetical protein
MCTFLVATEKQAFCFLLVKAIFVSHTRLVYATLLFYTQDNHHAMYVSNLNTALKDSGDHKLMGYTLSELVAAVGADKLPQSVETKVGMLCSR